MKIASHWRYYYKYFLFYKSKSTCCFKHNAIYKHILHSKVWKIQTTPPKLRALFVFYSVFMLLCIFIYSVYRHFVTHKKFKHVILWSTYSWNITYCFKKCNLSIVVAVPKFFFFSEFGLLSFSKIFKLVVFFKTCWYVTYYKTFKMAVLKIYNEISD